MTVKELREILSTIPDDTTVLIEQEDVSEIGMIVIQYHADGRMHVILSSLE